MKNKKLLDIIGEIDDKYIEEAAPVKKKKLTNPWIKRGVLAAAGLIILIGIGTALQFGGYINLFQNGNESPDKYRDPMGPGSNATMAGNAETVPAGSGYNGGGIGHDGGSVFMSYAGPVFPLTLTEEDTTISAERNITLDFQSFNSQNIIYTANNITVADSYVLTNSGDTDKTVHILYPFASSFMDLNTKSPGLSSDGTNLETTLHGGSFAGVFYGAEGIDPQNNPGTLNLAGFQSWEEYRDLLANDDYLNNALKEPDDLSGVPVIVYEFTDAWGPHRDEASDIPNPTIRVMFDIDYSNTIVLSFGFNGSQYDKKSGWGKMGKEFSLARFGMQEDAPKRYLLVIGEDIENITTEGYATGGWTTTKKVEAGVTINRSESNLEEILEEIVKYNLDANYSMYFDSDSDYEINSDLGFALVKEHLSTYGPLSGKNYERYEDGSLEEIVSSAIHSTRVFYLEAAVSIPAGDSITLDIISEKAPSFDYYSSSPEGAAVKSYDMVTKLGSKLNLTKQTAKLEDHGLIEIVRQNYGFDLENGIKDVELTEPHYYLEVRAIEK